MKSSNKSAPNRNHASRGAFFHVRLAVARRRSVRLDRCASTRRATHWGLICLVGGSSGHAAPWLRGRTAAQAFFVNPSREGMQSGPMALSLSNVGDPGSLSNVGDPDPGRSCWPKEYPDALSGPSPCSAMKAVRRAGAGKATRKPAFVTMRSAVAKGGAYGSLSKTGFVSRSEY
jgi:hypothetical protein